MASFPLGASPGCLNRSGPDGPPIIEATFATYVLEFQATLAGSQRYPVVAQLDNAEGRFRPGMLATALFEIGSR